MARRDCFPLGPAHCLVHPRSHALKPGAGFWGVLGRLPIAARAAEASLPIILSSRAIAVAHKPLGTQRRPGRQDSGSGRRRRGGHTAAAVHAMLASLATKQQRQRRAV